MRNPGLMGETGGMQIIPADSGVGIRIASGAESISSLKRFVRVISRISISHSE